MTDIQVGRGEAQVTRKLGHEYITAGSYFKSAEVAGVNGFPPNQKSQFSQRLHDTNLTENVSLTSAMGFIIHALRFSEVAGSSSPEDYSTSRRKLTLKCNWDPISLCSTCVCDGNDAKRLARSLIVRCLRQGGY